MEERGRAVWVARHVLPHEPALRIWLRRSFPAQDVDDVIQESYCRIAAVEQLDRIVDPRRYLFQIARNVALASLRRAKVVRIDAVGSAMELDAMLDDAAGQPSVERIVHGRWLLAHVERLLARLPERARAVIRLRKLDGLSQREIAKRLGVTETIVENDLSRGLRVLLAGLSDEDRAELSTGRRRRGRASDRPGDR